MGGVLMSKSYAMPGSPCPVFVAGIKYKSVSKAAIECEISQVWLANSIKKNDGAPIIVKNQFIVTDFWVRARIDNSGATT
jgi:hypothetical protein